MPPLYRESDMANDYDGEPLTLDDLWHIGYAVGTQLRPEADVYDGLTDLSEWEYRTLRSGHEAGARDTARELAARVVIESAPLPVCDDEIPF